MGKQIPPQSSPNRKTVNNSTSPSNGKEYCCFNFRYLQTKSIVQNDFNNCFRDSAHFQGVMSGFIGIILPKISELKTSDLFSGGRFAQQFHFHKIDLNKYEKIKSILEAYQLNENQIQQFLDGESIYQFVGHIEGQHNVESRVVCEYIDGVIYVLFFDTNHHIYFQKSKVGESLSFSYCPFEDINKCDYSLCCFAKDFLDVEKVNETYGFNFPFS